MNTLGGPRTHWPVKCALSHARLSTLTLAQSVLTICQARTQCSHYLNGEDTKCPHSLFSHQRSTSFSDGGIKNSNGIKILQSNNWEWWQGIIGMVTKNYWNGDEKLLEWWQLIIGTVTRNYWNGDKELLERWQRIIRMVARNYWNDDKELLGWWQGIIGRWQGIIGMVTRNYWNGDKELLDGDKELLKWWQGIIGMSTRNYFNGDKELLEWTHKFCSGLQICIVVSARLTNEFICANIMHLEWYKLNVSCFFFG